MDHRVWQCLPPRDHLALRATCRAARDDCDAYWCAVARRLGRAQPACALHPDAARVLLFSAVADAAAARTPRAVGAWRRVGLPQPLRRTLPRVNCSLDGTAAALHHVHGHQLWEARGDMVRAAAAYCAWHATPLCAPQLVGLPPRGVWLLYADGRSVCAAAPVRAYADVAAPRGDWQLLAEPTAHGVVHLYGNGGGDDSAAVVTPLPLGMVEADGSVWQRAGMELHENVWLVACA